MKIKCLIVDDEVLAQDVIEKYILATPTLALEGKSDNAIDAIAFLHDHNVDLMFLDINMPEMGGLDMLNTLTNPPKVILLQAALFIGQLTVLLLRAITFLQHHFSAFAV